MKAVELYNFILGFIKSPSLDDAEEVRAAYPKLRELAKNNNIHAQFYLAELHNNPALGKLYNPQIANYWYNQARINGHPAVEFKRFPENPDSKDSKDSKSKNTTPAEKTIQYFTFETPPLSKDPKLNAARRPSFFHIPSPDGKEPSLEYKQESINGMGSNGIGRIFSVAHNKNVPKLFVKTPLEQQSAGLLHERCFNEEVYSGFVKLVDSNNKYRLITPVLGECDVRDALRAAKDDVTKINILLALLKELSRLHQLGIAHCDVTVYNFRLLRVNGILSVYAIDLANATKIGGQGNTWEEKIRLCGAATHSDAKKLENIVKQAVEKILVSARHLAPEIIHGKHFIAASSIDIYALKYIFQRYFENHVNYPHLEAMVLQCCSKNPAERPSLENLFIALEKCLTMKEELTASPSLKL